MTMRLLLAMLWTILCVTSCGPEAWERDSMVQAAKKACKGLDEGERYDCIERHAVETLNPDVCRLAGIWIDDMCLQTVYEAAGDPAICERLYLEGVRPTCRAYYAGTLAPMRRYTDSALGFAAEVPSNWEIGERTETLDPLGHPWFFVEFRSELYAYGHQAFNQYGMRVKAGPSLGSTLTETVELSLASLIPAYRDQVQVHCCLTVGGEQAIELLNYPPTRWGNRQIVVFYEGREYRLDFFPLAGLTTATPAGVGAQVAFEAFLRTFAFVPVTSTPMPPGPTVTPVPTPTSSAGALSCQSLDSPPAGRVGPGRETGNGGSGHRRLEETVNFRFNKDLEMIRARKAQPEACIGWRCTLFCPEMAIDVTEAVGPRTGGGGIA